jgi:hypothetical protein
MNKNKYFTKEARSIEEELRNKNEYNYQLLSDWNSLIHRRLKQLQSAL